MNETVLPGEANFEDEALALRALKGSNLLGERVAKTRGGTEVPNYTFAGHRDQSALSNVVELPKANGLEMLRRLRDAERTKVLPLLVYTRVDPPYPVSGHRVGGSVCGSHTSVELEDQAKRAGLCHQAASVIFTEALPEYRGSRF